MSATPVPAQPASRRRFSFFNVIMLTVPLALVLIGVAYWQKSSAEGAVQDLDMVGSIRGIVQRAVPVLRLDPAFKDANNDLLADTPDQPDDPAILVFAPLPVRNDEDKAAWVEFAAHLEKATGKKVEVKPTANMFDLPRQMEAMKKGELHLAAFNTGTVPTAVNTAGFIPVCVPGAADGSFGYRMLMIVPANSPLKNPMQLGGSVIAFTDFRSHSGFKAPLIILQGKSLMPGRDYAFVISGDHERSIRGVAEGKYPIAAVASDQLERELASGRIKEEQYRIVYNSDRLPPAGYGYSHRLKPELAKTIREAFLSYKWDGSKLGALYKSAKQEKFVPIDYRHDWEFIRDVDVMIAKWGT